MTDEQIKGIARAITPHWWNDDIDLLDFTRAVLARAGQKHPSSGESHEDSLKSRDEALLRQALEALETAVNYTRHPDYDWCTGDEHDAQAAIAALKERLK